MTFTLQHKSPDYSAVYVVFKTDGETGVEGHGLTFTLGRGNELGNLILIRHVVVNNWLAKWRLGALGIQELPLLAVMETASLLVNLYNYELPRGREKTGTCHRNKTMEREMGGTGEGKQPL